MSLLFSKENYETYLKLLKAMMPTLRQVIDDQDLLDRFEQSFEFLHLTCGASRDPKDYAFCLVAHGDVWSNNVLVKLDENGRIADIKFIDFQGVFVCLFIVFVYFIIACCRMHAIKTNHGSLLSLCQ